MDAICCTSEEIIAANVPHSAVSSANKPVAKASIEASTYQTSAAHEQAPAQAPAQDAVQQSDKDSSGLLV